MNDDYFQTSDLGAAACLCTLGYRVLDVDKTNPKRIVFLFENSLEVVSYATLYWNGDLVVPPQKYMDEIKHLKGLIYG